MAPIKKSVFVPWAGEDNKDILCEQHKRTVNNNNCVSFKNLTLQIPKDQYRCNYVKTRGKANLYDEGTIFEPAPNPVISRILDKGMIKEEPSDVIEAGFFINTTGYSGILSPVSSACIL